MAGEWQPMTLRAANVTLIDCDHRTPPAADDGYPYVAIPQMRGGRIELAGARRISREHYVEWTRKAKPSANDVILSRRCNPGETAVAPAGAEFALGQNLVLLRADGTKVYPPYLRWLVRGPDWWEQIGKFNNVGAVFDSLKCADVPKFELRIPPLPEQRAIAHILGTLDDKIELNRRMSETLEVMARALFKSWFVDFDPVRAKAEGRARQDGARSGHPRKPLKVASGLLWPGAEAGAGAEGNPGLPKPLADLFPARLVNSELGEIPQGWEVKPIGDLAEVVGGSTPKTGRAAYWEGGTHQWVTPKDLSGLSMPVLLATERRITDTGLAQVSSGLLPKGTVLLSSGAPIGYLAIAEVPVAVNQGFVAMKPRPDISNLFLLRWASAAHDEIVSHANGSTFLEISKSSFRPIRTVAPATPVMRAFDLVSRPMYLKVVEHERESRTLAALRDALLPKLISGELRLRAAKGFLQAVV